MTGEREPARVIIDKSLRKETILLLASDAVIRKVMRQILETEGYLVLNAQDLSVARDWLKQCEPDLLMVRHYVENVPGHEAAMYLRAIQPGLPVLMVGGIMDDPALKDRESIREFEIFPRPYKAVELLDKVREVLLKIQDSKRRSHNAV
jgi:DNA-binding NtrC family response regulator